MTQLLHTKGIEVTSSAFRRELRAIGERLRVNPNFLAAVMATESGFRPWIVNKYGGATGLIQWMPKIAPLFGTTVEALRCMTDVEQLKYVERFYKSMAGQIDSPGTAYMLTFLPAFAKKPDSFVLGEKGNSEVLYGSTTKDVIYRQNQGFDSTGKGYITVGDVKSKANATYQAAIKRGPIDDGKISPEQTRGKNCPKAEGSQSFSDSEPPDTLPGGFPATPESEHDMTFPSITSVDRIRDPDWKPIQVMLQQLKMYDGAIDGDPGPKTMTALARWGKLTLDAAKSVVEGL